MEEIHIRASSDALACIVDSKQKKKTVKQVNHKNRNHQRAKHFSRYDLRFVFVLFLLPIDLRVLLLFFLLCGSSTPSTATMT